MCDFGPWVLTVNSQRHSTENQGSRKGRAWVIVLERCGAVSTTESLTTSDVSEVQARDAVTHSRGKV